MGPSTPTSHARVPGRTEHSSSPLQRRRRRPLAVAFTFLAALGFAQLSYATPVLAASVTGIPAVYGPAIMGDSLNNTIVGGSTNTRVSYRFRATESAALKSITIYVQTGSGYSAGTRGRLRISVRENDAARGDIPSSVVLASREVAHPSVGAGKVYTFPSPPRLQAGKLYHIVFANVDAAPRSNFVSVNGLIVFGNRRAVQPAFPRTDWAQLTKAEGQAWAHDRGPGTGTTTPIMGLNYANGVTAGMGYMEVWVHSARTISGPNRVREVFTVRGPDRVVSSVSIRLKRIDGVEPLSVRLKDDDGQTLAQGEVAAGTLSAASDAVPRGADWVDVEFSDPITLVSGDTYRLLLASPGDTEYSAFAIRKGVSYDYGRGTYFAEGTGEYNDGSGWQPFQPGWSGPGPEGDLQFYFRVDRSASSRAPTPRAENPEPQPATAVAPVRSSSPAGAARLDPQQVCIEAVSGMTEGLAPPLASDINVARTATDATVEWSVDQPATGQVAYRRADGDGPWQLTTFEPRLLDFHRQPVPPTGQAPLDPGTTYVFRICSSSPSGHSVSTELRH